MKIELAGGNKRRKKSGVVGGYQVDDDGRLEGLAETMVVPQYGVVLHDISRRV